MTYRLAHVSPAQPVVACLWMAIHGHVVVGATNAVHRVIQRNISARGRLYPQQVATWVLIVLDNQYTTNRGGV